MKARSHSSPSTSAGSGLGSSSGPTAGTANGSGRRNGGRVGSFTTIVFVSRSIHSRTVRTGRSSAPSNLYPNCSPPT